MRFLLQGSPEGTPNSIMSNATFIEGERSSNSSSSSSSSSSGISSSMNGTLSDGLIGTRVMYNNAPPIEAFSGPPPDVNATATASPLRLSSPTASQNTSGPPPDANATASAPSLLSSSPAILQNISGLTAAEQEAVLMAYLPSPTPPSAAAPALSDQTQQIQYYTEAAG